MKCCERTCNSWHLKQIYNDFKVSNFSEVILNKLDTFSTIWTFFGGFYLLTSEKVVQIPPIFTT